MAVLISIFVVLLPEKYRAAQPVINSRENGGIAAKINCSVITPTASIAQNTKLQMVSRIYIREKPACCVGNEVGKTQHVQAHVLALLCKVDTLVSKMQSLQRTKQTVQ